MQGTVRAGCDDEAALEQTPNVAGAQGRSTALSVRTAEVLRANRQSSDSVARIVDEDERARLQILTTFDEDLLNPAWNSRAVALGMHDFGGVLRQCHPAVQMLLRDQREDVFEFGQGRFAGVHERVAASKSRDLGHPGPVVLAVQHDFVVVEGHRAITPPILGAGRFG
jgi:hypothetical protein